MKCVLCLCVPGPVHHLTGWGATLITSGVRGGGRRQPHTGECSCCIGSPRPKVNGFVSWNSCVFTVSVLPDARWTNYPVWAWWGLSAGATGESTYPKHSTVRGCTQRANKVDTGLQQSFIPASTKAFPLLSNFYSTQGRFTEHVYALFQQCPALHSHHYTHSHLWAALCKHSLVLEKE